MNVLNFKEFLSKFPVVALPVVLGEDDHHVFSTVNQPLSQHLTEAYILPSDPEVDAKYTEFVPCFALENSEKYATVVYWKAGLLSYEYVLATFSLNGKAISQKVIAHTKVQGDTIFRSVAAIDEELNITVAMGKSINNETLFDAEATTTFHLKILPNGEIIQLNARLN